MSKKYDDFMAELKRLCEYHQLELAGDDEGRIIVAPARHFKYEPGFYDLTEPAPMRNDRQEFTYCAGYKAKILEFRYFLDDVLVKTLSINFIKGETLDEAKEIFVKLLHAKIVESNWDFRLQRNPEWKELESCG